MEHNISECVAVPERSESDMLYRARNAYRNDPPAPVKRALSDLTRPAEIERGQRGIVRERVSAGGFQRGGKRDLGQVLAVGEGVVRKTGDPFADYDNDGASNYDEYRAGTNPFDDTDRLAITAYTAPQNALHTLSFEYAGGHVYGVETTLSLTNPEWALQKVKKTETDAEHEQVMPSADEDDVGVATIYVVPAEGAKSQFFKVEAK